MSDWLVAYTEPHCEAKAVRFGPLFGLSCYCPQTYADGRRRPLFPRYLFVANFAGAASAARAAIGIAGPGNAHKGEFCDWFGGCVFSGAAGVAALGRLSWQARRQAGQGGG